MTLEPLLSAPPAIQAHVAAAVAAMGVGAWVIYVSRKGSPGHRVLGVAFLALIVAVCVAAMFIHRSRHPIAFGFSGTHLLVPFVLVMVWLSISSIRRGNIKLHQFCVRGLFMGALVVNTLINLVLVHGIIRDMVFPAAAQRAPAAIHGEPGT